MNYFLHFFCLFVFIVVFLFYTKSESHKIVTLAKILVYDHQHMSKSRLTTTIGAVLSKIFYCSRKHEMCLKIQART